jgi:hypothetical protein
MFNPEVEFNVSLRIYTPVAQSYHATYPYTWHEIERLIDVYTEYIDGHLDGVCPRVITISSNGFRVDWIDVDGETVVMSMIGDRIQQ